MVPVEKARRSQGPDAAWRRTDIAVTCDDEISPGWWWVGGVEDPARRDAARQWSHGPDAAQLGGGVKVLTQWRRGLNRVQISAA
jgi:hypothetical protein